MRHAAGTQQTSDVIIRNIRKFRLILCTFLPWDPISCSAGRSHRDSRSRECREVDCWKRTSSRGWIAVNDLAIGEPSLLNGPRCLRSLRCSRIHPTPRWEAVPSCHFKLSSVFALLVLPWRQKRELGRSQYYLKVQARIAFFYITQFIRIIYLLNIAAYSFIATYLWHSRN